MRETGLRWSAFIAGRRAPSADASVLGVLPGEGVGPEVIEASLKVAAAVESVLPGAFKIQTGPRRSSRSSDGGPAGLAPEVFEFCERIFSGGGAILSGPFGGRFVYELRRAFDLFCKLCPVRPLVELRSAGRVKPEYLQDVDLLLVRENVSGLYHGRWYEDRAPDGKRRAHHRFSYTEEEVRRVIEPAARITRSRRGRLALVVKDAGLPTVSALWRECATEVASEAGVELSVLNVDYAAYSIVQHAQALDVVVAPNLFGDILGDVAGILLGSRALVYSGNFGSGACAVYQTGHGAARDLAGTDRANPVGQIFSLAMLLRESFGLFDAADLVECAVCAVWRAGWRTEDLSGAWVPGGGHPRARFARSGRGFEAFQGEGACVKPVLLLVDMQNDYLRPPGLEPPAGLIVANAAALLASCRRSGVPVIHVWTTVSRDDDRRMPHWRRAGRWLCVGGTDGHATPVPLRPEPSERVIHKTFFSAFAGGELESALRSLGCDTIWIAGVHLHGCVRSTVLDAYRLGFAVWVAEDAVGSDDPLHAAISRGYLEERAARFLPVASFFADLEPLADAAGPIVSSATRASHRAWIGWRERSPVERSGCLSKLGALVEEEKDSFVRQMAREIGKPVRYARSEMERALALLRGAIRRADRPLEEGCGPSWRVRRRPLGVVAAITPWNNPVAVPLGKTAPALLHGNTVVWKPAVEAGEIATRLFDLVRAAGFPDGVVTMVEGGRSSARALMSDALVDAVSFTGSTGAGYEAHEICARRHVPLQAELGGNNAAIVWSDSELRYAAWRIAEGAFGFAGQRCTANRRVVVERSCYAGFLGELEQGVEALHWGDPAEERTQVGPLVSAAARDRVAALVSRSEPAADRVFTTRKPPPCGRGAYYPPTVICCQDPSHEIVLEETFGPVLVVQSACDWEEALRLCNGVAHGLAAALFSESPQRQASFLREVRAGIVKLNADTAGADAEAPFGGWKASGIGPPEHGDASREFYTRAQVVYRAGT